MVSRVLGCLYVTDTGSRTAVELVQRLQVSPAPIALAVRYLKGAGTGQARTRPQEPA